MEATIKTQRRRAPRKAGGSSTIYIRTKDGTGGAKRVTAAVVDAIDGGFGVNLTTPLKAGSLVVVGDHIEAEVRWCASKNPTARFARGCEIGA